MNIKKVMLINPSNTMPKDSIRRVAPPLGLLYLASTIKDRYIIDILDSTFEGYYNTTISGDYVTYGLSDEQVVERIKKFKPDVVGVSSMFSARQSTAIHYCDLVKSVNKDIIVVLGGIHPSLFPEESIMNQSVDYVIMGEGEFRFKQLLEGLEDGNVAFTFDGIAYKQGDKIKANPMVNRIENLDSVPFPARELIDFEGYLDIGVPFAPFPRKDRTCQILTSRGCPFNCVFCSTVKYWGRQFRTRSVENIMEEIDIMVKKYKIEEIQFVDDNLTINKQRARELFKQLIPYKLPWCTPHGFMLQVIDEPMIDLMGQSGAYQISVGVESGSDRVRKEIIHKPVPPKNIVKKLVDRCHKNNIQVHGLFVVGFPGETKAEIYETLQYPFDVEFDSASLFIANPMPGSELYYICKKKGYLPALNLDLKTANILIPKDSPDYVISRDDLVALVDSKTRELNEYSKQRHPEQWEKKFEKFLSRHQEKANLILGRVT